MGWFGRKDDEKTVLKESMGGGPKGLGDPNDKSLRKIEKDVLIPQIMRDRTREEKCVELVQVFGECCKKEGLLLVFNCRKENNAMKACMERWYEDPEFQAECTQQFLAERTRYRETGIKKKRPKNVAKANERMSMEKST